MAPEPEEWNCKLYLIPISLTLNFNYRLWLVVTVLGSRAPGYKESPLPAPSAPSPVSWWAFSGAGVIILEQGPCSHGPGVARGLAHPAPAVSLASLVSD